MIVAKVQIILNYDLLSRNCLPGLWQQPHHEV